MTYCTGSSSRDLFNYWGEEGWGAASADREGRGLRGTASVESRAGLRPRLAPQPLPQEGPSALVSAQPLPRRWGVDGVLHSCGISDPAGWQPAPRS